MVENRISPEDVDSFYKQLERLLQLIKETLDNRPKLINGERYLNTSQVCKLLNMNTRTLQMYRDKNRIGYVQISRKILYRESDIIRVLDENYISPFKVPV